MLYKKITISFILIIFSIYFLINDSFTLAQYSFAGKLSGKILLQVEDNGEAWYVDPMMLKRHYLGRPADALSIMRLLGTGISNEDIAAIPVAEANFSGTDSDGDGLSDTIEDSFGTDKNNQDTDNDGFDDKTEVLNNFNPLGAGTVEINTYRAKKLAGKIVLQIEQNGEAWYINPANLKRYYLGRPIDAFNIMRSLGLGITNTDLAKINKYQIEQIYKGEDIVKKYTKPETNSPTTRQYTDPEAKYTIEYPNNWSIRKFDDTPGMTQISDSLRDYITEKKGIISIYHFQTETDIAEVSTFRIATKGNSKTLSDKEKIINNLAAYENSYEHKYAFEKTTFIKINNREFLQISLATAKVNNNYYLNIYDQLINSLTFPDNN